MKAPGVGCLLSEFIVVQEVLRSLSKVLYHMFHRVSEEVLVIEIRKS